MARLLVDGYMEPGYHSTTWNARDKGGRDLHFGLYIARLTTPNYTQTTMMVLLK